MTQNVEKEHDLTQTCLEYNAQNNPDTVVQSVNAMKGYGKGLREETHMIPQTLPILSSSPDRKMRCGVFNPCASRINRLISGQDSSMFSIEIHIKGLE